MASGKVGGINPPIALFALLPIDAVEHMIMGFSHRLHAGVALLYADERPNRPEDIRRLEPPRSSAVFQGFCSAYRQDPDNDSLCRQCDQMAAWEYYSGQYTKPRMYQCHLNLWDMSFPLLAGDVLCGVLFAGQIVLNDASHLAQIRQAVQGQVPDACQASLLDSLNESVKIDQFKREKRFEDFCKFGQMIQSLITKAYDTTFDAACHAFLVDAGVALTVISLQEEAHWWEQVSSLSKTFCEYVGISSVLLLSRHGSRYQLKATESGLADGVLNVPAWLLAPLESDTLCPVSSEVKDRVTGALGGVDHDNMHVFKKDLAANTGLGVSTAVIVIGALPDRFREAVADFCRLVCLRADVTHLVQKIKQDAQSIRTRVRDALHHTKNPLQKVVSWHDDDDCFAQDAIAETRRKVRREVSFVKEYLRGLYSTAVSRREAVDLADVLREVISTLEDKAAEKGCRIVWTTVPRSLKVIGDPLQLRTALDNVIDNAVKYSWHGPREYPPGVYGPQDIRVNLGMQGNFVELRVVNYGIGIPPKILSQLLGDEAVVVRAQVPDELAKQKWKEQRLGSGLGVPISKQIIEQHGGWFHIDSRSADSGERGKGEEYHRYLTTVSIGIPVGEGQ